MSKYRNKKVEIDGYKFDSLLEGSRYEQLRLMKNSGIISDLTIHPRYELKHNGNALRYPRSKTGRLGRIITIELDFEYMRAGQRIIEDTKGYDTRFGRLKRALFEASEGVEVRLVP